MLALLCSLAPLLSCAFPVFPAGFTAAPNEAFYSWPDMLADLQAGEIFRERELGSLPDIFDFGPDLEKVVQVAYKTRLTDGNDSFSIASIFIPKNPSPELKIYSYQAFEDAVQLDCAPSYALEVGNKSNNYLPVTSNLTAIGRELGKGRHCVMPDHEGYISGFFAGRQEGYAGLDAIRATRNYLNGTNETPIGIYGYSGGGQATAWIVDLHDEYAPDLNFVGSVSGGTIVDAWGTLQYIDFPEVYLKGSILILYTGLFSGYPAQTKVIWPYIEPIIQENIIELRLEPGDCNQSPILQGYNNSIMAGIHVDLPEFPASKYIFQHESLLANYSVLPVSTPKYPRYMYHGGSDELAKLSLVEQYVDQQRRTGANLTFVVYPGLLHDETSYRGFDAAMDWLDAQLDSGYLPSRQ